MLWPGLETCAGCCDAMEFGAPPRNKKRSIAGVALMIASYSRVSSAR
jgi:hypothetical protein